MLSAMVRVLLAHAAKLIEMTRHKPRNRVTMGKAIKNKLKAAEALILAQHRLP
jgi:hypothetical protein